MITVRRNLIGHTLFSNSHHTTTNWNLYFYLIACHSRNCITSNRLFLAQEQWPNEFRTLNLIKKPASYRHYLHIHMHIPTLIIVELWFLDHNIPVLRTSNLFAFELNRTESLHKLFSENRLLVCPYAQISYFFFRNNCPISIKLRTKLLWAVIHIRSSKGSHKSYVHNS